MASPFSAEPVKEAGIPGKVLLLAAGAVLLVVAILAVATLRREPTNPGAPLPTAPYAAQLPISSIQMAEATNGGGGKVTYVDGTVKNVGDKVLTGATVQVTFPTGEDNAASQPQTVPLMFVRTRTPYVDLEPVASEPLRPGDAHEFRLIFEKVPDAWNTQQPQIRIIQTEFK